MLNSEQRWIPVASLLVWLLLTGCSEDPQRETQNQAKADGRPLVVCTIGMISDAAREIGGDAVHIYAMMGPGTDPHMYQPTTGDMRALGSADLILYNGLHLEAQLGEILEQRSDQSVIVAVAERIPQESLLSPPDFAGYHDPHVWFDLSLWRFAVEGVAEGLMEVLPEQSDALAARRDDYLVQLDELELYLMSQVELIPEKQRVLVTAHDAFGYFGDAYGFEVVGLQGVSTEAEAGIADVRALADFIAERQIRALFIESSVPVQQLEAVEAAVRAQGWEVGIGGELYSDAMGDGGTPAGTYFGMVRHNIDTIVAALQAD